MRVFQQGRFVRGGGVAVAIVALLLLLLAPEAARATQTAPVATKRSTASLVTASDSVGPGGTVRLGLWLQQKPGWHSYWRNPGDAGVPTDLAFDVKSGVSVSPIAWPAPERVSEGPITTFAYTGDVLLPVTVTVPKGQGLNGTVKATWLICANICVPESATFTFDLPPGSGSPSPQAGLFAAAVTRTPRPSPWPARIDSAGVLTLSGADLGPESVQDAWFAPYDPGRIDLSAPQKLRLRDGLLALSLKASGGAAPLAGVLTLRDKGGQQSAYDVSATPGPALPIGPDPAPWPSVLALAFLGGLLLNVMPCVFPVLAMKAAGLAGLGGSDWRRVRWLACSYMAGTVASFCALGGLLVLLRRAGELAGWGYQFQTPAFVAAAAFVLFGLGLNLSGVFAIGGGKLAGAGQGLASRGGHLGSFATGGLAVLVATPCTAPFMGAAITAALASPGWLALGVFAGLGIGLASPFVVLTFLPDLGRMLPRPGPWMERLRQGLAFPLYLTVAWLAWVLAQQAGADGVVILAVGCVMLAFGAWLLGLWQRAGRASPALAGVAAALTLGVFASVVAIRPQALAAQRQDAFSPQRLQALREQGRPVFVDMTASWCVSCLVNERVALDPGSVRAEFARRGIVLLRGDWTRQDPAITLFLRDHGSDGVPLYVFYPAGGGAPVVLPQILTPGIVLDAVST